MNLDRLLTRPLQVTNGQPAPIDTEYGVVPHDEPTTTTVLGYVEQTSTTEEVVGQQTTTARWWAAVPPGTPVSATSRITVPDSGQRFEVVGAPATRWDPRQRRVALVRLELAEVTA